MPAWLARQPAANSMSSCFSGGPGEERAQRDLYHAGKDDGQESQRRNAAEVPEAAADQRAREGAEIAQGEQQARISGNLVFRGQQRRQRQAEQENAAGASSQHAHPEQRCAGGRKQPAENTYDAEAAEEDERPASPGQLVGKDGDEDAGGQLHGVQNAQ